MRTCSYRHVRCFVALLTLASTVSCASSSSSPMNPSERSANLRMTVDPNPLLQNGIGACANENGQAAPGNFRLFPHSVTLEETGGVGATLQSYRITALVNGQEFPVGELGEESIAERFDDCGGSGSRIEPSQRRCNAQALFCSPLTAAVPNQLKLRFSGIDDNGHTLTGETTVSLSMP
jgi:hypothetical protein